MLELHVPVIIILITHHQRSGGLLRPKREQTLKKERKETWGNNPPVRTFPCGKTGTSPELLSFLTFPHQTKTTLSIKCHWQTQFFKHHSWEGYDLLLGSCLIKCKCIEADFGWIPNPKIPF